MKAYKLSQPLVLAAQFHKDEPEESWPIGVTRDWGRESSRTKGTPLLDVFVLRASTGLRIGEPRDSDWIIYDLAESPKNLLSDANFRGLYKEARIAH